MGLLLHGKHLKVHASSEAKKSAQPAAADRVCKGTGRWRFGWQELSRLMKIAAR
jgi:hypothetical protein